MIHDFSFVSCSTLNILILNLDVSAHVAMCLLLMLA